MQYPSYPLASFTNFVPQPDSGVEARRRTIFCDRGLQIIAKFKNIFEGRFSILRAKKCLATPRVAALQHPQKCDEWNHNSDEWSG